eukprot:2496767-Lingulodinium_polyedra.AAC.1
MSNQPSLFPSMMEKLSSSKASASVAVTGSPTTVFTTDRSSTDRFCSPTSNTGRSFVSVMAT